MPRIRAVPRLTAVVRVLDIGGAAVIDSDLGAVAGVEVGDTGARNRCPFAIERRFSCQP
jgi:hypothetical protein